jgi:hypothetical protein
MVYTTTSDTTTRFASARNGKYGRSIASSKATSVTEAIILIFHTPDHYYYLQTVGSMHYNEIPVRCTYSNVVGEMHQENNIGNNL